MRLSNVFLIGIFSLILLGCKDESSVSNSKGDRPNIILIMTDDQGFGDIGYNGNPVIQTPTLDALAKKSTRLTNFYVSPVCAPTRASLMTGRFHIRTGVYDTYNGGAIMAAEELTIAEVLKDNGYQTAIFGKWHLGDNYPFRPIDQGFSTSLVHGGGGVGQVGDLENFFKYDSSYFNTKLSRNGLEEQTQGYCSDVYTDEAIKFVKSNTKRPFFLYLAFNAPHTPLQLPKKYYDMYREVPVDRSAFIGVDQYFPEMNARDIDDARRVYGMVTNIDDNLGRLVAALEEQNIMDNTIIIFLTDNGPQQRRYVAGLRGRKGSAFEGGIRVPFFIHNMKQFRADYEIETPSAHIDIFPTILDLCGLENPNSENIDGVSLVPMLSGQQKTLPERPLYFHWQRGYPELYQNITIRKGDFKLVGQVPFNAKLEELEMFNIAKDPYEQNNLIDELPDLAAQLKSDLDAWFNDAIRSENNLKSQRIIIGSDQQSRIVLNRNDAKGKPGIWAQNDIYGYWDVHVEEAGRYDFQIGFREPIGVTGTLTLKCAPFQVSLQNEDTTSTKLMIKGFHLDEGDYMLESWYRGGSTHTFPFYIAIEKSTGP